MKKIPTKRILALMCALMLIGLLGCSDTQEVQGITSPVKPPVSTPSATTELLKPATYVIGINAAIYEKDSNWRIFRLDDVQEVTVLPNVPEGMLFDHWEIDGAVATKGDENGIILSVYETTVVEAVLRPLKKAATVNASMRFVNSKNAPVGDIFTELVFENDYQELSNTMPGGNVTLFVQAEIPNEQSMDYWLINGVPHFFGGKVTEFVVKELNAATVYEAVLLSKGAKPTLPSPTDAQPVKSELLAAVSGNVSDSSGYEQYAVGVGCTVGDGARLHTLNGLTEVLATASLAEGFVLNHWEIDGVRVEGTSENNLTLRFSADKTTVVRAVMQKERAVTSVNSYMRYLDERGEPSGETFYTLMFDGEYSSAIGAMRGGTVTVHVCAEIPKGQAVIGWKINGVAYYPNQRVSSFIVQNQDVSTEYEPIFHTPTTPKPKPSATLEPTPSPPPPQPDDSGSADHGSGPVNNDPGPVNPDSEPFDPGGGYVAQGIV